MLPSPPQAATCSTCLLTEAEGRSHLPPRAWAGPGPGRKWGMVDVATGYGGQLGARYIICNVPHRLVAFGWMSQDVQFPHQVRLASHLLNQKPLVLSEGLPLQASQSVMALLKS